MYESKIPFSSLINVLQKSLNLIYKKPTMYCFLFQHVFAPIAFTLEFPIGVALRLLIFEIFSRVQGLSSVIHRECSVSPAGINTELTNLVSESYSTKISQNLVW